jgi:hypothetical protein
VLSREDARKIELPPASPLMGESSVGVDVDLALVHMNDALESVRGIRAIDPDNDRVERLQTTLEGVATILRRLHQEFAA